MFKFEWDEEKNRINIRKHSIDFVTAERIFAQPMWWRLDDREDYEEERFVGYGLLEGIVVVVVFTHKSDKIRIISIRKANRRERQAYQEKVLLF